MLLQKRLIALFVLFFISFGCKKERSQPESRHPLLLISFDGFRHDYLSKADTPNFDQLANERVRADGLIPVFPSKTFPNHYAIATGLWTENNGIVGNTMYDPKFDAWYHIGEIGKRWKIRVGIKESRSGTRWKSRG